MCSLSAQVGILNRLVIALRALGASALVRLLLFVEMPNARGMRHMAVGSRSMNRLLLCLKRRRQVIVDRVQISALTLTGIDFAAGVLAFSS